MHNSRSVGDHVTALSYQSSYHQQYQRLLCATTSISPPKDPSKNWPDADRRTAALGHTGVETRISVDAARFPHCLPTHDVYVDHQR